MFELNDVFVRKFFVCVDDWLLRFDVLCIKELFFVSIVFGVLSFVILFFEGLLVFVGVVEGLFLL